MFRYPILQIPQNGFIQSSASLTSLTRRNSRAIINQFTEVAESHLIWHAINAEPARRSRKDSIAKHRTQQGKGRAEARPQRRCFDLRILHEFRYAGWIGMLYSLCALQVIHVLHPPLEQYFEITIILCSGNPLMRDNLVSCFVCLHDGRCVKWANMPSVEI